MIEQNKDIEGILQDFRIFLKEIRKEHNGKITAGQVLFDNIMAAYCELRQIQIEEREVLYVKMLEIYNGLDERTNELKTFLGKINYEPLPQLSDAELKEKFEKRSREVAARAKYEIEQKNKSRELN